MTGAGFADRYGPWALIAGASEGIGAQFARRIAAQGINVALLARRAGPLEELRAEIEGSSDVSVRAASIDLTAPTIADDVDALVGDVEVGFLVYNAGAAHDIRGFLDRPVENALHLVDLNCRGVVLLVHRFGGAMAKRGKGGIILMSSMAAAAGSAFIATYAATKAFDLVLAEGLWMELGGHGVDVLGVPAGLTDTPAMQQLDMKLDTRLAPMDADDVAAQALDALGTVGPVFVPGDANREMAQGLWPIPRANLVTAMSQATASLYEGLEVPSPLSR
jgi:uncharacterized protein